MFSVLFVILSIVISCSTNLYKRKNYGNLAQTVQRTFKKINHSQAFETACKQPKVISNRYLQATCDGKESTLDLNKCLYNENGVLIYEANGEFHDSCSKCKLNFPYWQGKIQPINFECKCYDEDMFEFKTNINLKDFVYYDKVLKCADIDERKLGKPEEIDTKCDKAKLTDEKKYFSVCEKKNIINFELDKCISNNNRAFDMGSHYSKTCQNCNVHKEKGVYVLTCDCEDDEQSRRREYKPINSFLEYSNSEVNCFDPTKKKTQIKKKKNSGTEETKESGAIINYHPDLSPSENLMRNCGEFSFDKNILTAECGSNNILLNLDLNKCISNIEGELKFKKNGNYGKSCNNCEIVTEGYGVYSLECVCKRTKQALRGVEEKKTKLSLGEKIIIRKDTKEIDCLHESTELNRIAKSFFLKN